MYEIKSANKKTLKILNKKFIDDKKFRSVINKYISKKSILFWSNCKRYNVSINRNYKKTLYSPESDISYIPNKIILATRTKNVNCLELNSKQFLIKKLTKKQKRILGSKLIEKNEKKINLEKRKTKIKEQIVGNVIFTDIGGNTTSLGVYFKFKKKISSINNSTIKKFVKKQFNIDKKSKIIFSEPYQNFNIKFSENNIEELHNIMRNPIKIVVLIK